MQALSYFLKGETVMKDKRLHGNGRPILKVDQEGNVVARYPSIRQAALANFTLPGSITRRCDGLVKKEYTFDGCTFRYGDE